MVALKDGTTREEAQVVAFDGKRYKVLSNNEARTVSGRRWAVTRRPTQAAEPKEFPIEVNTFHEGSGFSFDGLPGVYDFANGWDGRSPGKLATWPRFATGTATVLATAPGKPWLFDDGLGYVYMLWGRYISKYLVNLASATWTKAVADVDLGAANVVAGRPASYKGKWYIPVKNLSTGVAQVFQQLTPGGAGVDAYAAGPAGAEALGFQTWRTLLARYNGISVYTVSANPLLLGDWGAATDVDNSSFPITDLAVWDKYLMVRNARGLWSFDENLKTINEIPDLQSILNSSIGPGMAYSNGYLLVPHIAALVRWHAGSWLGIGPEQEHALEGDLSEGWGPVSDVVPYGEHFYAAHNDSSHGTGAILSYSHGRGSRGPLVPHCHHQATGTFEGLAVVQDTARTQSLLVAAQVSADRLTATPYAYELERAGMFAADDPSVAKAAESVTFYTSRLAKPSRSVQKTYRTFEFWLDASPQTNTPGLQVWASVDNGAFFQLADAAGAAATSLTTGFKRLFFPATAAAVGHWVQLRFTVPAKGAGVVAQYTIREGMVYAEARPQTTEVVSTWLKMDRQRFEDGTEDPRTVQQQLADLKALFGPNSAPVSYNGPNGETGFVAMQSVALHEAVFKEGSPPVRVAQVSFEVTSYTS